jgi:rsbT co-antagonist protein RsbR
VAAIPTRLQLTADDKAAIKEFWKFYEPIAGEVSAEVRRSLEALPEWSPIVRGQTASQIAAQEQRSLDLQRRALDGDDWAPYLEDVRAQGATYAKMGVSFLGWYDVIAIFREALRRRYFGVATNDLEQAIRIGDGMNRYFDIAMAHLGEAYLSTKESIIAQQQRAIRELSTPVLQVSKRVLVVPIVGSVDQQRARQLTERMLVAIRDRRAPGVVLDVTGVPDVDTAIANHLVQTCSAARLMGACVVITGVSAEIAQALVALGATLPNVETHVDLQEGIARIEEEIDRLGLPV